MKYSMPPMIEDTCTTLILGSLPGEKSLTLQAYYAHPQNQFWKILCSILNEDIPIEYEQKKKMLLRHHIALWDVVHSAEREGSLDTDIKNATPNDIGSLLASYKNIKRILLNGGKANSLFKKYFKKLDVITIALPSTSPAYASVSIEEKTTIWRRAILQEEYSYATRR